MTNQGTRFISFLGTTINRFGRLLTGGFSVSSLPKYVAGISFNRVNAFSRGNTG